MATRQLNSGAKMPSIGFGVWPGVPYYSKRETGEPFESKMETAVYEAVKFGWRHFDCATIYYNHTEVGNALRKAIADGLCTREELFVTSKVWNTQWSDPEAAIRLVLEETGLSYLDLYLVHSPCGLVGDPEAAYGRGDVLLRKRGPDGKLIHLRKPVHQLWKEMEDLVDKGLTKSIGVSNFSCLLIHDMLSYARIPPAVNQIEIHPYHTNEPLAQWCLSIGLAVQAYCPLAAYKNDKSPLTDPVIERIAKSHNATAAQVCLAWSLKKGYVPLTKTDNVERLKENLGAIEVAGKLTADDVLEIDALNKPGISHKICEHASENEIPLYN